MLSIPLFLSFVMVGKDPFKGFLISLFPPRSEAPYNNAEIKPFDLKLQLSQQSVGWAAPFSVCSILTTQCSSWLPAHLLLTEESSLGSYLMLSSGSLFVSLDVKRDGEELSGLLCAGNDAARCCDSSWSFYLMVLCLSSACDCGFFLAIMFNFMAL